MSTSFIRNENKHQTSYYIYLLFIIISAIFLALASVTTSPLIDCVGRDSEFFLLLGRYFKEGMTPYVDLFDHKGPFIFFIEAFGLSLAPDERTGLFIMQIISLSIVQALIYHCARFFLNSVQSITVVITCLFVFSFTIQGGNLTEEYSLPFLFLTFFFTLQYSLSGYRPVKFWQMFSIGISAAVLFWLRPTNLGVIGACSLFIFIMTIRKNDWQGLRNLIGGILSGFTLISILVILYFIEIGAFDEMIYATFTYNLKYASKATFYALDKPDIMFYIKTWLSLGVLAVASVLYFLKGKDKNLVLLGGLLFIFNLISTKLIGPNYYHYMTLNIPCLALGLIFIIDIANDYQIKNKMYIALSTFVIVFFFGYFGHNLYKGLQDDTYYKYKTSVEYITSKIPESELDRTFAYNISPSFWFHSHLKPYCRYFVLQDWHQKYDENITHEINNMMENRPPLWLVIQPLNPDDKAANMRIFEIIAEKFYLFDKDNVFELYRLKDEHQHDN